MFIFPVIFSYDVIIGFSSKERLLSSDKRDQAISMGKEDPGWLGILGLSILFQYNQMSSFHILGFHFFLNQYPHFHISQLGDIVNSTDVENLINYIIKFCVWILAVSAYGCNK